MTALCRAAAGGEKLEEPAGGVGDGSEQFSAQHNCAALTSGASAGAWAFSQQSVMPVIGHSFSPECAGIGVPASTPPTMARRRIADVSHFAIFSREDIERGLLLSRYDRGLYYGEGSYFRAGDHESRRTRRQLTAS